MQKLILNKIDKAILKEMQREGKISNVELAKKVHLSPSACLRRVKLLEEQGIIQSYAMLVNQEALGLTGNVFVEITLSSQKQDILDAFEEKIREVPEVMECYLITGDYDYLLRVVVTDTADFERLHHQYLSHLPGVTRIKTLFTLRTVTKKTDIPLPM
jgi:Lrp/AsnC family transcriptional regulator, leucine-responsive regulatory protein